MDDDSPDRTQSTIEPNSSISDDSGRMEGGQSSGLQEEKGMHTDWAKAD